MNVKIFKPEDAIKTAAKLKNEKYKHAEFCIAAGSIVAGSATAFSDLDLVVIFPALDSAFRESFVHNDMPIEAFVHDYETIQAFMDADYNEAHSSIIHMIASGKVIPTENKTAQLLKDYASKLMEKGPENLGTLKHETLRYFITDLIDDLRGQRPPEEQRAILYMLYAKIGQLALRQAGQYISDGKHLARKLKSSFPSLLNDLEDIMRAAHTEGIARSHIQKLEDIARSLGGPLFEGYKQNAPANKRASPRWLNNN